MGVDHVHLLLVHEPALRPEQLDAGIRHYLGNCRARGLINGWGLAGDLSRLPADPLDAADVLQHPYDLIGGAARPAGGRSSSVTFGFLSGALPATIDALRADPVFRARCSGLIDRDLSEPAEVAALLARDAVANNPGGIVLTSTTKVGHLQHLAASLVPAGPRESEALAEIGQRLRASGRVS
jgi:hypothetical protein